ncbi:MAG: lactoylglutathione lyase family protein [Bacteroidetes bacterium]|nr:MAG: lactoylglutathione lyase family protein [Bacteroidota bacterium]
MDKNSNSLNWFEIPATDISRAKKFYENIFSITMDEQDMMGMQMAFFPAEMGNGKANGCLCKSEMHKPSMDGAIIYLNANSGMDNIIGRIESSGGKMIMPKTQITPEIGFMAFFVDSEGNRMALHSQN